MQVIADLQLHSKYARAVSPEMVVPKIWSWAKTKGIGLIATGDWTHPLWMNEIKTNLEETGKGLLQLKNRESDFSTEDGPLFLLSGEVSSIFTQGGKGRRVHTLIFSPDIQTCEKINKEFTNRGANLLSDGRPIIGLSSIQVAEVVLSINPDCLVIPAHIWTPWFSLYGSKSGFDSIEECYGSFAKDIYAVETGLSSDPSMNWRIKELDSRSIVSFSDAHSGPKLGREATVFELAELNYENIRKAIMGGVRGQGSGIKSQEQKSETYNLKPNSITYTIEFYPEEGKYHYTGHRACGVKQDPRETSQKGTICPVCGKELTVGVLHRVEELAGRTEEELKLSTKDVLGTKVKGIFSQNFPDKAPYIKLVPLQEILAEVFGGQPSGQNIQNEYKKLVGELGSEFKVLLNSSDAEITKISGEKVATAIKKVRTGDIVVDPGYDGVFGVVKIWEEKKTEEKPKDQLSFF